MAEKLTNTQYNIIKRIAEQNGFKEYLLKEYTTSAKGDNYLGQIVCVTIKEKDKTFDIVVKKASSNEMFRKAVSLPEIFGREIFMYDNVLKTFANFQKENGLERPFTSFPKLYGTSMEKYSECIILENLIKNGYKHWNRKISMNSDHIAIVMTEYGKLHAVSFAMKKKNPKLFKELAEVLIQFDKDSYEDSATILFLKQVCTGLETAIKGISVLESAHQRVVSTIEKYFLEEIQEPKDKMVITHGDAWCNNILFKYEDATDPGKPTKVSFIDWQMSKYGTPLQDLVHFFYASCSKQIMDDYKKYMKIYYNSLSDSLRKMSCNPEDLFTFEDLDLLWKKFGKYGLILAGFVYKILDVDSENVPDIQNDTTSMEHFFQQFESMANSEEVKKKVVDLYTHMVENDFV